MNREEIDVMWNKALHESVQDGEQFTRYHFATLVAAKERAKMLEELRLLADDEGRVTLARKP